MSGYLHVSELKFVQNVYADHGIEGLELAPTRTHNDWRFNWDGSLMVIEL